MMKVILPAAAFAILAVVVPVKVNSQEYMLQLQEMADRCLQGLRTTQWEQCEDYDRAWAAGDYLEANGRLKAGARQEMEFELAKGEQPGPNRLFTETAIAIDDLSGFPRSY